ncbi:hypothetical protein P8452_61728 [Trifolium repens]|nr:hypothetical protein P8452_61728 [Trifolium repens]WJX78514.1 hypothetical protein P8452_61728 [Trifolium repens]
MRAKVDGSLSSMLCWIASVFVRAPLVMFIVCLIFLMLMLRYPVRALREFEFEDVRKLSAELCGRIHPQVLFPVICSKLALAVNSKNVLKIKACLFSICTSLVVRGWESLSHPLMHAIKRMIETALLWPCLNVDSVSKVQHGCIDCLALMICAELQAEESITDFMPDRIRAIGKKAAGDAVVTYVMNQFFNDKKEHTSNPEFGEENCESVAAVPLSFHLCMGNVLICWTTNSFSPSFS